MGVHNLDRNFRAERIALLGASPSPRSFSGTVLSNLVGSDFRGVVDPIHATQESVLGVPCWPAAGQLPGVPDLQVPYAGLSRRLHAIGTDFESGTHRTTAASWSVKNRCPDTLTPRLVVPGNLA